ncbi:MAG TPA: efflux RND transporter periplasmic adaptor subunit [Thermoanaerobaculia bacterium]|nr:efflux RND transporter periplasmic adaptor subunit [Thermoanaerobaculia bacterium]
MAGATVVVLGIGGAYYLARAKSEVPKYRATPVDSGTVVATVTATGTLSAVTTVAVGSQVSGIISKLYVDFNSHVKKGQLLAELDPTPFQEALDQQRANLLKSRSDERLAGVNLGRQKRLRDLQLIAASDYDTAVAQHDDAAAVVKQTEAALKQAETNLSYTSIKAPIDGVVVDREYNVGQTVAASFQAPLIFSIAQDLTKMQVLTNIDEADVGGIKLGQAATFTVDAYPDQTFRGAVAQIRLSTQTVQNVVTYPVMLDVPNLDGKLMPGMTANVVVPVDVRRNTLRVPNAALRFKPDDADVLHTPGDNAAQGAAGAASGSGSGGSGTRGGTGPSGAGGTSAGATAGAGAGGPGASQGGGSGVSGGAPATGGAGGQGGRLGGGPGPGGGRRTSGANRNAVIYLAVSGSNKLRPVRVVTSITDGAYTAVRSKDLKAGDPVVIGLQTARAAGPGAQASRGPRF